MEWIYVTYNKGNEESGFEVKLFLSNYFKKLIIYLNSDSLLALAIFDNIVFRGWLRPHYVYMVLKT